jgi:hypothetical protein
MIEFQNAGSDFTNICQRLDDHTVKLEVVYPPISPWIKKADERMCRPYDRANITAFMAITEGTGQCQIISGCWATVLFADDMIDLTAEEGVVLVEEAILTDPLGTVHDEPP